MLDPMFFTINLLSLSPFKNVLNEIVKILKKKYMELPAEKFNEVLNDLYQTLRVWAVFFCCLLLSGVGVALSFLAFGGNITGSAKWGIGLAISIIMLGITYGAKYANADARRSFTPVDFIQYLTQGFLWPSTWPALASLLGVTTVAPPKGASAGCSSVSLTLFARFSLVNNRLRQWAAKGLLDARQDGDYQ